MIHIIQSLTPFCRRSIGNRRLKFYNNNSVENTPSLAPAKEHPPSAGVSIDPVYNIENETINKSTISQIPSDDEKGKDLRKNIIFM